MKKIINISGVQDAKNYINSFLTRANEHELPLKNVEVDGYNIIFTFGKWGDIKSLIKVEEYSKAECLFLSWRSQSDKTNNQKNRYKWTEKCIVETTTRWLVIFSKDIRRN